MTPTDSSPSIVPPKSGEFASALSSLEPDMLGEELGLFAQYLSGAMERRRDESPVAPGTLALIALLATIELQRGSGDERQVIGDEFGPLIGCNPETYERLLRQVPLLGGMCVSGAYGDSVLDLMVEQGLMPTQKESDQSLSSGEITEEPIRHIDTAYTQIVQGARRRLVGLDWNAYGIMPESVGNIFDNLFDQVLDQAPIDLPIKVLFEQLEVDGGALQHLLNVQKMQLSDDRWLVMTRPEIPADYATATQDYLLITFPQLVLASFSDRDPDTVLSGLTEDLRGPLARAATRFQYFIDAHPEVIRSKPD